MLLSALLILAQPNDLPKIALKAMECRPAALCVQGGPGEKLEPHVARAISKLGFEVLERDAIEAMLIENGVSRAERDQLCHSEGCLTQLQDALGALGIEYLVVGRLTVEKGSAELFLTLRRQGERSSLGKDFVQARTWQKLKPRMVALAKSTMAPLLRDASTHDLGYDGEVEEVTPVVSGGQVRAETGEDKPKRGASERQEQPDLTSAKWEFEIALGVPLLSTGVGYAGELAGRVRYPILGYRRLEFGLGLKGGSLPAHAEEVPALGQQEGWLLLSSFPRDLNSNDIFYYLYESVHYVQVEGKVDFQIVEHFLDASFGLGLGIQQIQGVVRNITDTGARRRDDSVVATWPGGLLTTKLGVSFRLGETLVLGCAYSYFQASFDGLQTMQRVFESSMERHVLQTSLGARF